jgi:hypothetical protein
LLSKSPDEVFLRSKSAAVLPSKSSAAPVLPNPTIEGAPPNPTAVVIASRTLGDIEMNGEHLGGQASTGIGAGAIVGPLFALLAVAAFILFFVYFRRRKKENSLAMSQDGNELSFETENTAEFSFEDEMSDAGSQYANLSDDDNIIPDFAQDTEETLFGF